MSEDDRLYQEYLRIVEGFAWFRTYYQGDAYASETLENLAEARRHWDATLIAEPIDEPSAGGKRDGFEYVRVTYRKSDDLNLPWTIHQKRVLAQMQARHLETVFASALRAVVRTEGASEEQVLWDCLNATASQYFQAAINAVNAGSK